MKNLMLILLIATTLAGCDQKQEPKQGTVHWQVTATGYKGRGQPIDYKTAKAWAEYENRKHPDIRHWVE